MKIGAFLLVFTLASMTLLYVMGERQKPALRMIEQEVVLNGP